MISGQTLGVCPEGKPVSTFPDHALDAENIAAIKIVLEGAPAGDHENQNTFQREGAFE